MIKADNSIFRAEQITKSYDGQCIIEDISLSLMKGECIAILGTSGVGKTTLFNVLSGLEMPDSGSVYKNEVNITAQTGQVGYMLQDDLLFEFATIIDNVTLPFSLQKMPKKEAYALAYPLLSLFGLEQYEHAYPNQLSGGMRQRASLLRTYLFESDVLLLDEPFSALDPLTKYQMHDWYNETVKPLGVSTIFITHDVDEAILLADRVYIIVGKPGHIINEYTISLDKPRNISTTLKPEFIAYKTDILRDLGITLS